MRSVLFVDLNTNMSERTIVYERNSYLTDKTNIDTILLI